MDNSTIRSSALFYLIPICYAPLEDTSMDNVKITKNTSFSILLDWSHNLINIGPAYQCLAVDR